MIKANLIWLSLAASLVAQTSRTPPGDAPRQAKTPEEFDLYLTFNGAADAEVRHKAALRFERQYPQSELLVYIYESEIEYARSRNEYNAAIVDGEKTLKLAPNDIKVLLALAEIIPNGIEDPTALSISEKYATSALDLIDRQRMPHEILIEDCDFIRHRTRSRAHAALGQIAAKRNNLALAIHEFETALTENPSEDGVQLYRLGRLYRLSGRQTEAASLFERARAAGPPEISKLAARELNEGR
jgi:tetratricopeptide (TPR) repeat protein